MTFNVQVTIDEESTNLISSLIESINNLSAAINANSIVSNGISQKTPISNDFDASTVNTTIKSNTVEIDQNIANNKGSITNTIKNTVTENISTNNSTEDSFDNGKEFKAVPQTDNILFEDSEETFENEVLTAKPNTANTPTVSNQPIVEAIQGSNNSSTNTNDTHNTYLEIILNNIPKVMSYDGIVPDLAKVSNDNEFITRLKKLNDNIYEIQKNNIMDSFGSLIGTIRVINNPNEVYIGNPNKTNIDDIEVSDEEFNDL